MMYCEYTKAMKALGSKITPSTDGHGKLIFLFKDELDALAELIESELYKINETEKERSDE